MTCLEKNTNKKEYRVKVCIYTPPLKSNNFVFPLLKEQKIKNKNEYWNSVTEDTYQTINYVHAIFSPPLL